MGSTGRITTTAIVNKYTGLKNYTLKTAENEVTITQNYDHTYTAFDNNGRSVNGGTFRYLNEAKAAAKRHLTDH